MKGKALRKHSLHEKTAASVLLKMSVVVNIWVAKQDVNVYLFKHSIYKDINRSKQSNIETLELYVY